MSDQTCHIYVIAHMKRNKPVAPVKIGISSSPEGRVASLQTANPGKLVLLATFSAPTRAVAKAIEYAFHSVKSADRISGEWFDIPPMLAVEAMCQNMRAAFDHFLDDDELHTRAVEYSGLAENEQKLDEWRRYVEMGLNDNAGGGSRPCQ